MMLSARLTICDLAIALDGGTTYLKAIDETGREHSVTPAQHAFPRRHQPTDAIPGRLYFDDQLVPMRPEFEVEVLSLLKSPQGEGGGAPDNTLQTFVARIIEFVESDPYVHFAERVEQADDETKYDVWLAWTAENRQQPIVRLGVFLGTGLRAAAELLETDRPLAEGASGEARGRRFGYPLSGCGSGRPGSS